MHRYLTILLSLLFATLALGSDTILTGRPHFPGGGVPAGYTLTLYNPYTARDTTTNTLILPHPVAIRLDATGAIPTSPAVHVPDVATLAPGNTYYRASFTDPYGTTTNWGNLFITGASLDIGTLTPTPISPPNFWVGLDAQTIKGKAVDTPTIADTVATYDGSTIKWKAKPVFDVTQSAYGAKCDGTTNDTAAIQLAATAASATGGVVEFPPAKICKSTAPIIVAGSQVKFRCSTSDNNSGTGCGIINAATGPIVTVIGAADPQFNCDGVIFIGNANVIGGAGATVDGIQLNGGPGGDMDATIRGCTFSGVRRAIWTKGRNVNIYDNLFQNSQVGVYIDAPGAGASRAYVVHRNRFHGMGTAATDADVYINDPAAYNIVVKDNFRDEGQAGRFLYAPVATVSRITISGNHLDRMRNTAIELLDATGVEISNNHIYGEALASGVTQEKGIVARTLSQANITGNIVSRTQEEGIYLYGAAVGVNVSANTITNASQEGDGLFDAILANGLSTGGNNAIFGNVIHNSSLRVRYGINSNTGWTISPNRVDVASTSSGGYTGAFDVFQTAKDWANYYGGSWIWYSDSGTTAKVTVDGTAGNITAVGTIRANTGFSASGTAGMSGTVVVKGSDGNNCNLVYSMGLLTSTTCP